MLGAHGNGRYSCGKHAVSGIHSLVCYPDLAGTGHGDIDGNFFLRHGDRLRRAHRRHINRGNGQRRFRVDGIQLRAWTLIGALGGDLHARHQLTGCRVFHLVQRNVDWLPIRDGRIVHEGDRGTILRYELGVEGTFALQRARLALAIDQLPLQDLVRVDAAFHLGAVFRLEV